MPKILGRVSSINVRKVLWACDELGITVEHEPWGQAGLSLDSPDFLRLNPNGMVPVLVEGEFVLWESNAICRYLGTVHPNPPLLPQDPCARAVVEQWMDWQATELNNSWRYAFMALVRKSPTHTDSRAIEASIQSWNRHMAILEASLAKSGAFVTGAQFTLADVVLGLSTHRWYSTPFAKPDLANVGRFYQQLNTRPGFLRFGNNGEP
ncbi:MAG: glutathione S-transferase [Pseudomonadota bacterium]|jgi:glutathione S-transferase|nr:glutathione S-transferase [Pseudomonadota bacterium]